MKPLSPCGRDGLWSVGAPRALVPPAAARYGFRIQYYARVELQVSAKRPAGRTPSGSGAGTGTRAHHAGRAAPVHLLAPLYSFIALQSCNDLAAITHVCCTAAFAPTHTECPLTCPGGSRCVSSSLHLPLSVSVSVCLSLSPAQRAKMERLEELLEQRRRKAILFQRYGMTEAAAPAAEDVDSQ